MRTGYFTDYPDVIEWSTIREMCPTEADALHATLAKHSVTEGGFAYWMSRCEPTERDLAIDFLQIEWHRKKDIDPRQTDFPQRAEIAAAELLTAWTTLQRSFEVATTIGGCNLTLHIDFYDAEDEGRAYYGGYKLIYFVGGAYQLSPAGHALANKLIVDSD
jgi:hypothetical protein